MTPETQVSGHKANGDKKGRPWFGENQAWGAKPEENQGEGEGEEKKTKNRKAPVPPPSPSSLTQIKQKIYFSVLLKVGTAHNTEYKIL